MLIYYRISTSLPYQMCISPVVMIHAHIHHPTHLAHEESIVFLPRLCIHHRQWVVVRCQPHCQVRLPYHLLEVQKGHQPVILGGAFIEQSVCKAVVVFDFDGIGEVLCGMDELGKRREIKSETFRNFFAFSRFILFSPSGRYI